MGLLSLIKSVPTAAVKTTAKVVFKLKKASPHMLVIGGAMITTTAFVIAIMNARKMDATIAESNEKIDAIEQKKNDIQQSVNISQEEIDRRVKEFDKELNKAKAESVWKMFCLVGAPSLLFLGGLGMVGGGYLELFRRFGKVSAFAGALMEKFGMYRQMNIAEHGEECDQRYMYGITGTKTVTEKITDDNGKEKTIKSKLPIVDENCQASLYSFVFSEEFSRKCPRDPVNTIAYLQAQEKYWNVYMSATGKPVTLAMVLEDLGIEMDPDDPRNDYIYIVGWRPNGDGDNHIEFGIMRAVNKRTINMEENVVMLNFNCDGNLYHSARYDKNGKKVC